MQETSKNIDLNKTYTVTREKLRECRIREIEKEIERLQEEKKKLQAGIDSPQWRLTP